MGLRFPNADYRDLANVAKKLGFYFYRQAKGSHEIWRRDSDGRQTTIPCHGSKTIKRRTVKSILNDFQISVEEFIEIKKQIKILFLCPTINQQNIPKNTLNSSA